MPGDDAAKNGLTVWMPAGALHPQDHRASRRGQEVRGLRRQHRGLRRPDSAANGATGPYLIKGCTLPDDVPPAVADLLPYFQKEGATAPALEFLSPIKGPALEQITVEVGSGIRPAADGAALYDEDVKKQASSSAFPAGKSPRT